MFGLMCVHTQGSRVLVRPRGSVTPLQRYKPSPPPPSDLESASTLIYDQSNGRLYETRTLTYYPPFERSV